MISTRAKEYSYSHLKLVSRLPELRALEGWYELPRTKSFLEIQYELTESKLKFSRWLLSKGYSEAFVAAECRRIAEQKQKVKLSCRFNDILRLSSTPHFRSCLRATRCGRTVVAPARICGDPRSCLLYVPDEAGHFKGRAILCA
jgi:hypothetical protein